MCDFAGQRSPKLASLGGQWMLLLLAAFALSPISIGIAIGQDSPPNASGSIANYPEAGSPPAPGTTKVGDTEVGDTEVGDTEVDVAEVDNAEDSAAIAAEPTAESDVHKATPNAEEDSIPATLTDTVTSEEATASTVESSANKTQVDGSASTSSDVQAAEISELDELVADALETADVTSADVASADVTSADVAPAASAVRNLSVKPGTQPLMPEDAPAWITATPDFSSSLHRLTVSSLPTASRDRVDEALDEPLLAALYEYVDKRLIDEPGASDKLRDEISVNFIRKNLIDDPSGYIAELSTSNGPMYQKWVSLSISPQQQEKLKQWYGEAKQRDRLAPLALTILAALGTIGLSHLALRRRHGLPKQSPITDKQLAAFQSPVAAPKKRCCTTSSMAGVFICVLIFPAIIFASLLLVRVKRSESSVQERVRISASSEQVTRRIHEKLSQHGVKFMPEMPAMPEMPDMPPPHPLPTVLQESGKEVKLKSGNQMIIIRTQ